MSGRPRLFRDDRANGKRLLLAWYLERGETPKVKMMTWRAVRRQGHLYSEDELKVDDVICRLAKVRKEETHFITAFDVKLAANTQLDQVESVVEWETPAGGAGLDVKHLTPRSFWRRGDKI